MTILSQKDMGCLQLDLALKTTLTPYSEVLVDYDYLTRYSNASSLLLNALELAPTILL